MSIAAVAAGSRSTTRAPCRPRIWRSTGTGLASHGVKPRPTAGGVSTSATWRPCGSTSGSTRSPNRVSIAPTRGAVAGQPRAPPVQGVGGHGERHLGREPVAVARRRHVRPGEERQVGAGVPFGVRVEQVVGAGIVLVDAPLDQAHAEDAGVEVEVLLRRSRDRRDVMQSVDAAHA